MRGLLLPHGKETLKAEIEEEHLAGVLVSELHDYKTPMEESRLVQEALEHPIETPRLCDVAIDKKKVVVISSDHTGPVPSHIIIPLILKEIRKGSPDTEITILISTGLHREITREELELKFGPEITENETVMVHNCNDTDNMVCLGKLSSGGNLYINKLAVEANLLVMEGFIELHFFTGFSDGRKSVLPGVASRETTMCNHNSAFIGDPHSRTGIIKGNPIHNDMLYAARVAGLDFIVSVVINSAHEPILAMAGDCDLVHRVGKEFLVSKCQMDTILADIIISTNKGYPLDQNIYQSVKGTTAAEVAVKEGEVIIMLSKAADGHGGKYFHGTLRDEKDLNRMIKTFMDRKPEEAIIDQWRSQIFARVMLKARIVFVSSYDDKLVEGLRMIPAHIMGEALEKVKAMVDKEDYKVTVIPSGVSVIVRGQEGDMDLRFILIPDSFKRTLNSSQICAMMDERIKKHFPDSWTVSIPVAGGGEGSMDTFITAVGDAKRYVTVGNPYFEDMESYFGLIDGEQTAVIEMASCTGLPLVEDRKDPRLITTYGIGQLILAAAGKRVKEIVAGLGDSSTNDSGCSAAVTAGIGFYDRGGREFIPTGGTTASTDRIDLSGRDSLLEQAEIVTTCDIDSPMYRPAEASFIFGPQKGADEVMALQLDEEIRNLSRAIAQATGADISQVLGTGAAGAMEAGMIAFSGSKLQMGVQAVLGMVEFDEIIGDADYIPVGEGKLDSQSLRGKVVIRVAKRANRRVEAVIAVIGGADDDEIGETRDMDVTVVFPIDRLPQDFSVSRHHNQESLAYTVDNIIKLVKAG